MKWLLCLWVNSNRRERERERSGKGQREQWKGRNRSSGRGTAWTKWSVYFKPLHSGHTSPYGALFTLHVHCCPRSNLYLQLQHIMAYQAPQMMQILFWTHSLVMRFSCSTLFVLNGLFWGTDSLSHMLWKELLSIEVNLCSTLTWKDNDRHSSSGVLSVTGEVLMWDHWRCPFHILIHNKEGKRFLPQHFRWRCTDRGHHVFPRFCFVWNHPIVIINICSLTWSKTIHSIDSSVHFSRFWFNCSLLTKIYIS